MEYVALDLETTGLDAQRDGVIEVGAVTFTEQGVIGRLERFANPGRRIPEQVARLTGIRNDDLRSAPPAREVLAELVRFCGPRQVIGHGAGLDLDFLSAADLWEPGRGLIDTLHIARILLPNAPSHSLPMLAAELGLEQPRPHRALDDADATRQLFLRLRDEAAALDETLKEKMLALVAPYGWPLASFFAEALVSAGPAPPGSPEPALSEVLPGGPRRRDVDDDPRTLAGLLGPEGPLARALPEYEHREQQQQMLLAVAQVMARGGRLVVEAGTGTGKSLAYLVPALARAVGRGERVVVSTYTHTLQEQLMAHDLPALREWLPWDFEACLLKGRPNYVSLRRWRRYLGERCQDEEELRFKLKVLVWLHQTETGDRSELRLHGREEVLWARIASDPLDCIGLHCTEADCFVHRARAEAEKADLVVVNHALLLADANAEGGILPPYEHLVLDEAHHLEDAATQGMRQELDGVGLLALLARVGSEEGGRRTGLIPSILVQPRFGEAGVEKALEEAWPGLLRAQERVQALFEVAGEWVRTHITDLGRRDENLRLVPALRELEDWAPVRDHGADAAAVLAGIDAQLRRAVYAGRDWLGGDEPDQDLRELEIIRGRLAEAAGLLRSALVEPDPNFVYWFTTIARTSGVLLRSAPVDVGGLLRDQVYAERRSVVFTSASLAIAGSFDYFCSRAGLVPEEVETLALPSPFDYLEQALVCLPADVPEPQDPEFESVLVAVVGDIARRIGGRTLVLFTSHQQLREVHLALHHRRDLDDVLLLGQGIDGQRRQVLKSFMEADRALLLGTASFWEGIDIPGDRLSCVIVVRLPFPVPTEPVFAARAERVRDSFAQYALPLAALRLKQGFGRLIRRSSDRGAVVILDGRISRRDYGRAFLDVLPQASQYRGRIDRVGAKIEEWLGLPAPLSPRA